MIRGNNNQTMLAALCLLALFATSLSGCGGCSATGGQSGVLTKEMIEARQKAWQADYDAEHPPAPPAQEAVAKAPSLPSPPPTPPVMKPAQDEEAATSPPVATSPRQGEGPENAPSVKTPAKPARPKDVADWKRDDYYSAKQDGDPRLVDAVRRLGERFVGNESAAELLTRLLGASADDPFTSEPNDEDTSHAGSTTSVELTEAVVAALVANGTPKAKQTLERIANESLRTANDQAATPAVLKALLSQPGAANEDLLLQILTMPDESTSEGPTATMREDMRGKAIAMVASTASEAFRARLASAMIASETSQADYDQLWTCLKQPKPENLAAQIVIYQSDRPDAKSRELLEQSFALQGSEAMGRLFGIRLPKNSSETTDPYRVVERMWSDDFAAAIERQLLAIDTLAGGARLASLASTIPNPALRAALLRTMERHWDQGPKGFDVPVAARGMTREPGSVVVLKMLPHREVAKAAGGKELARPIMVAAPETESVDGGGAGRNGGTASPWTTKTAAKLEVRRRQEQTAQQWAELSRGTVAALCKQLLAIAKARQASAARAEWCLDDVDLPFKPHPRAAIAAAYRLDWPDDLKEKVDPAPVLRVRYVRIEQKAQPAKVLAYYRRQLPKGDEHAIAGGLWIESLDAAGEEGNARSIDVFLTKASASVPGLVDQEQELTVEILTVECAPIAAKGSQ